MKGHLNNDRPVLTPRLLHGKVGLSARSISNGNPNTPLSERILDLILNL